MVQASLGFEDLPIIVFVVIFHRLPVLDRRTFSPADIERIADVRPYVETSPGLFNALFFSERAR
jgi:hypothetical protein